MAIQLQFLIPPGESNGEVPLRQEDEGEIVPPAAILLLQVLAVEITDEEGRDDPRS